MKILAEPFQLRSISFCASDGFVTDFRALCKKKEQGLALLLL
jgi:hypothetical protein